MGHSEQKKQADHINFFYIFAHDGKAAYLLARCLKELCCNIKVILADGRNDAASRPRLCEQREQRPHPH